MPGLLSEYVLKGVRLRNRIAISPMTQYSCGADGVFTDWHFVHLGARAVGGAGLVIVEQLAVSPEGRMTPACAGIWSSEQVDALRRVTSFIKSVGSVPGLQLGHSGRKGAMKRPWDGHHQLADDDPDTWQAIGPSEIAYGGRIPRPPRAMTRDDIADMKQKYVEATHRALDAGFEWMELHYAHGFLGASFMSPMANDRDDEYGGSAENRARFLVETFDAVRAVWPDRLPLTVRIGAIDFHEQSHPLEDSIALVQTLSAHGLDLVDISMGMNSDVNNAPWGERGFMVPSAARIRAETGVPTAVSWNLGDPLYADEIIRMGQVDLLMVGRPALANPHWPIYAAMALGQAAPYESLPDPYRYFLNKAKGVSHVNAFGLPPHPGSRGTT